MIADQPKADEFHLLFVSTGPFTSLTDPNVKANAARIDYGHGSPTPTRTPAMASCGAGPSS